MNNNQFTGYNDGSEMWRDNVSSNGIDEAIIISRNYLDMNLKREHSEEERQFCCELFAAMHEATASRIEPSKLVYPYDFKTADERIEAHCYHTSRKLNEECAKGIDSLIHDSLYKPNHYNLELAAMGAIQDYGFTRTCLVLAFNYQNKGRDGCFSETNRKWANRFTVQEKAFKGTWLRSHPILIDSFCSYVRELYQRLDAERFALSGNEEHGEIVGGYEVRRAIVTSNDVHGFSRGFAIGYNPKAVSPWVCWHFAIREDERHYNWGIYGEEKDAIDAYNARLFAAYYN
jgi:hypothetical protein